MAADVRFDGVVESPVGLRVVLSSAGVAALARRCEDRDNGIVRIFRSKSQEDRG